MPERAIVTKELAILMGILSHAHRIRIVEELRQGELDVQSLQAALGISQAGVSQHLAVLRARRVVAERRDGRHVYYHLRQPALAAWLMDGLRFVEESSADQEQFRAAIEQVRTIWPDTLSASDNS